MNMSKDLSYYRSLPYARRVRLDADEGGDYFVAYVAELDGVEADGASPVEATYNLLSAFDDAIEAMLEWGHKILEPDALPGRDFVPAAPRAAFTDDSAQLRWQDVELSGASSVGTVERDYQLV